MAQNGCWSGRGEQLIIANIPYKVTIQLAQTPEIKVCAQPAEALQQHFVLQQQKQGVRIQGRDERVAAKVGQSVQTFRGAVNHVVIGENAVSEVTIGGITQKVAASNTPPPSLKITVAPRTNVVIDGLCNEIIAGATNGNLDLKVAGSCDINFGSISILNARLSGSVNLQVAKITDKMQVFSAGMADIQINGGQVEMLDVEIVGSGDMRFNGTAKQARLRSIGSGDIWVKEILTVPVVELLGVGDVTYNQK